MEDYKCSSNFKSKATMSEDSTSFEFLSVRSQTYLISKAQGKGYHESKEL